MYADDRYSTLLFSLMYRTPSRLLNIQVRILQLFYNSLVITVVNTNFMLFGHVFNDLQDNLVISVNNAKFKTLDFSKVLGLNTDIKLRFKFQTTQCVKKAYYVLF